jgi:hypothetical protein
MKRPEREANHLSSSNSKVNTTYYHIPISPRFHAVFCFYRTFHNATSGQITYWIRFERKWHWPESATELYRPSDRRLSAKLMPTFADRGCHVVSVTEPHSRIVAFLDRSRYFFFRAAPRLHSRGWVDSVPDPLLVRKCGSAGNRTLTSGSVVKNSDH